MRFRKSPARRRVSARAAGSRRARRPRRWTIETLEPRQLLAGDVVMFNDHIVGAGTGEHVTSYSTAGSTSGLLKDSATGQDTAITLSVSAVGALLESTTGVPAAGTDAHTIFDGFVDFSSAAGASIALDGADTYTHAFSGLDPALTYDFAGTAVRGRTDYTNRWTLVTINGADAFTAAHSAGVGVVTAGLAANEVALWTGANHNADQGFVARWTDIDPGSDGLFEVVSRQYVGSTPGVGAGSAAGGSKGYAIHGLRLIEVDSGMRVVASDPADGEALPGAPTVATIDFSLPVVVSSLQSGDLTIDATPAVGHTLLDADTVEFDLPAGITGGEHTLQIAAGALTGGPDETSVEDFSATFTVLTAPSVDNVAASAVTAESATIGAEVIATGGEDPNVTIYWGDEDGGQNTLAWDASVALGQQGVGVHSRQIDALTPQTTYYYRALANNAAGDTWAAATASFTTPAAQPPTLINLPATNVGAFSARLQGQVTDTGGQTPVVTVYYGDDDAGDGSVTSWDNAVIIGPQSDAFSHLAGGLTPETTYYYRAAAENDAGVVWATSTLSFTTTEDVPLSVVINEIHYDPFVKTELVEFVELLNAGDTAADLSDWYLADAVDFTFPQGTLLDPGDYLVVSQDPAALLAKYGVASMGPFVGKLDNDGEEVELRSPDGQKRDAVDYRLGFPWPTTGEAPGYSIELIHPTLDNDLGGSWRSSSGEAGGGSQAFVQAGSVWNYFKGTTEPSAVTGAWRLAGFDDASWLPGTASIGYGDGHVVTELADMRGSYSTVYLRQSFDVPDASAVAALTLEAQFDDGFNAWINGTRVAWENVGAEEIAYDGFSTGGSEDTSFRPFTLPNPAGYLVDGENVIAVQLLNVSLDGSSDAWFDGRLTQSASAAEGPTPGQINSVLASNAAPQMRQVDHNPQQPVSGQDVTVTIKATDPDGVAAVTLDYQLVDPGDYIELGDPRYQTQWTTVAMNDDGTAGDRAAGDDVYSVVLPGTLQTHRRLVRYRITVEDTLGAAATGPYADDPQPNFAYFVYDGVPSWTGSLQPGAEPDVEYDAALLESVPVYQLITTRQDHLNAMYVPYRDGEADQELPTTGSYGGQDYLWQGALVYDGVVYDHIDYRARGGVWRYSMGKNMWKFDFNRGHYFQARDDYGRKYDVTWDKLNFSALIQQGNFQQRGEQGLFEAAGFTLHNLADNAASNSNFLHFRIVEDADEGGPDQFSTDFQGVYLTLEQPDGRLLEEHGLPDGNFYKMEGGTGELNNQGPTQPSDKSDLNAFMDAYENQSPDADWWRANFDLDGYYSFRVIAMAIHDYDIHAGKNYFYYHNPETGKWSIHNWDLDLTWTTTYGGGGGNEPFRDRVLAFPEFRMEYNNRRREIHDLLFNPEQTGMLLDEIAQVIDAPAPGEPSLAAADAAMWDFNPILTSSYVNLSKASHGRYYENALNTDDFAGMVDRLKQYVETRQFSIDPTIAYDEGQQPATPTLTYTGDPNYPLNALTFQTSSLTGGSGQFAAMQWRIAEVTDPAHASFDPAEPRKYEITADWESAEIVTFDPTMQIPADGLDAGKLYRVRVRLKDSAGRWSHWSDPEQFVIGPPTGPQVESLRITELMFNPADPTPTEAAAGYLDNDDFEFIELTNIGAEPLDLTGVRFVDGIEFDFTGSGVSTLAAGDHVLVVRDVGAFEARYGTGLSVAGEYGNHLEDAGPRKLSNGGETLTLLDPGGATILDFEYGDNWYEVADGDGFSLVVRDVAMETSLWDNDDGWRASEQSNGNPGEADLGLNPGTIEINELMSNPTVAGQGWVELHNTSAETVDLGGWWLSDDPNTPAKYQIAAGTSLSANEYLVLTEQDHFGPASIDPGMLAPIALSRLGGTATLRNVVAGGALGGYQETQPYEAAAEGVAFARHTSSDGDVDFTAASAATQGGPNAPPRVGPIVVNELMYNPASDNFADEFIELLNPTAADVDLFDPANPANTWALLNGVAYEFPTGVTMAAGERILLSPIEPEMFRANHGIDPAIRIFGPYLGQLNNGGESVEFYRPGVPEPFGLVPMIRVEKVEYDDDAPWPAQPDGDGASLSRVDPAGYGNDVASWGPSIPGGTPGTQNYFIEFTPPTVPDQLTATVADVGQVDLNWAPASDPESGVGFYRVWRNGELLGSTTVTSFSDTLAVPGTLLSYQVSAVNGSSLESAPSAAVDVTILGVESVAAAAGQVTITFTNLVEAVSAEQVGNYRVSTLNVLSASLDVDGRTVTLTTTALQDGQTHQLQVTDVEGGAGTQLPTSGFHTTFTVDDGLQLRYTFDGDSAPMHRDNSGNNRHADAVGATTAAGTQGDGLSLDGLDDRLDLRDVDLAQWLGETATLSYWINTTQVGNPGGTVDQGRSIGVNFRAIAGGGGVGAHWLDPTDAAGFLPQTNWNNAESGATGSTANIEGPIADTLVDDTGATTAVTISYSANTAWSTNTNTSTGDLKLFGGYLDDTGTAGNAVVTMGGIPYSTYDVYVYVGSSGNGRTGRVRLNGDPSTDRWLQTNSNPFAGYVEATATTEAAAVAANYVHFAGVTGDSVTVEALRGSNNYGIHGVQIVSAATLVVPAVAGAEAPVETDHLFWGALDENGAVGVQVGDTPGVYSAAAVNDGQWHHVALTRSAADGQLQVFVDGMPSASATGAMGTIATPVTSLGMVADETGSPGYLDAALDDVRIYDRVLDASEIASLADPPAQIADVHVFYNDSAFDGNDSAANAGDDNAVAADKQPLRPGSTALPEHVTNFDRGVNGVMIDLWGIEQPSSVDASSFEFRVGNGGDPATWPIAPPPADVTVRAGAGVDGSDRVTIVWDEPAALGAWLRMTVPAGGGVGLDQQQVFYFGNAPGETGNDPTNFLVTAADLIAVRDNGRGAGNRADVLDRHDVNRDRYVDAVDALLARNHATGPFDALRRIGP